MKQRPSYALVVVLLTLAAGGLRFWYYHQLAQLNTQLASSASVLMTEHKQPAAVHQSMYCNGQPVPVGPDGVGTVRFRVPTRPGLASWLAAIRLSQNGRDTTFTVRVPYRVAYR